MATPPPDQQGGILREIKQTRPFRSGGAAAFVSILKTADVLRRRMTAMLEPWGITLQQYNVLRILRGTHPDPLPTLEIRERLIEQAPGITRLLDNLDDAGLVRRERCTHDRRQVHCWITEEGLRLLASTDGEAEAVDAEVTAGLTDSQVADLLTSLESIRRGGSDA